LSSRYNIGLFEQQDKGNMDRALKHYKIAAGCGFSESLKQIQKLYASGYATKDDYMEALRAHQSCLVKIKSHQREKAAASNARHKYY